MTKSLQAAAGLSAAPRPSLCRTHGSRKGLAAEGHSHRRCWPVAGHSRLAAVCVSSAQEDDQIDNEEAIAGVETLLVDEEPEYQPADSDESTDTPMETAVAVAADQGKSGSESTMEYSLNFLWLDRNVAVAVDQFFPKAPAGSQASPLTEYFFWPRNDAWEELKICLETKPWISERDKVLLLNRTTEVINFWQDEETKHTIDDAKKQFPDCKFSGT